METQFDIVVLGAGPGGYVAAIRAAQMGAACGMSSPGLTAPDGSLKYAAAPTQIYAHDHEKYDLS
jgi:pyruvate/2-oxoglutarate dehydrogenase complex dihydrolipoamide dehydrogenase (E3) component